jgi:ferredoxin
MKSTHSRRTLLQVPQKCRVCATSEMLLVGREEHICDAAFAAGVVLPALCHQGRCLTCAARLEGPGEVDQSDSVSYYSEDREAGFVLLCTGKPRTSLRVRTHQAHEMRERRRQKKLPAPYS